MADLTGLNAAVDAAVAAAAQEQTVTDSVVAFIENFNTTTQAAIAAAIEANDAVDNSAIAVAQTAVQGVTDATLANIAKLSAAITTPGPVA